MRPHDVIMPEADAVLGGDAAFAPEPLSVFELRSSFFEDARLFPRGTAVCDSAFRLAAVRTQPATARSHARRGVRIERGTTPAVPSPL